MNHSWRLIWAGFLLLGLILLGACGGSEDDSARKDCVDGACELGPCTKNEDCARGLYCGPDFECTPDPCTEFSCGRGRCVRGTQTCESKASCTEETESLDCVEGEYCLGDTCVDEDTFCADMACERGVCDAAEKACVNAVDCDGQDALCAAGFFCNATDACVEDLCEANQVECPAASQCNPAVGECEVSVACENSQDCAPGHLCVAAQADQPGVCTLESVACGGEEGDGGCVGNQVCSYDPEQRRAACAEPETCQTALDCLGDRQCGGKSCMAPVACIADGYEPNEDAAAATDFSQVAVWGALDATLCPGDVDIYQLDTQHLGGDLVRGTLSVTLEYAPRDAGLGELQVELFKPRTPLDDGPVATASSGRAGHLGRAEISLAINPATLGKYLVRVRGGGDLLSAGVGYRLAASFQPTEAENACDSARPLLPGDPIIGDTTTSAHSAAGSTCTSAQNPAPEDLYFFEVLAPSLVTLKVEPDVGVERLSLSLRSQCDRLDTEVACEVGAPPTATRVDALLSPGTYYARVEAPAGQPGGGYTLSKFVRPALCTPADSFCQSESMAHICGPTGFGFQPRPCPAGCEPRTGRCLSTEGDHCGDPFVLDSAALQGGFSTIIDWNDFRDDHQIAPGGCVPMSLNGPPTDGADAVWQVEVPAHHALNAALTLPFGEDGALYVFDRCADVDNSCLVGANEADATLEQLQWINESDLARTVFLAADRTSRGAQSEARLEISVNPVVCEPDETACDGDQLQVCRADRSGFELARTCEAGCDDGRCNAPPNDTCAGAYPLTGGVAQTGHISHYTPIHGYYSASQSCFGNKAAGPEAVYSVTTTEPHQTVEIELDASFAALLYVSKSCVSGAPRCFAGNSDAKTGSQTLSFVAAEVGTYYLYIDSESAGITGAFSIEATVRTPSCQPGEPIECDGETLRYCDADGQVATYACADGCQNAACGAPGGQICADPIVLRDGDVIQDTLDGSNLIELGNAQSSRCILGSSGRTRGEENIYRVDLSAGDLLSVEVASSNTALTPFIAESCVSPAQTCQVVDSNGGPGLLQYYAEEDRSVYVVVDAANAYSYRDYDYTLRVDISRGLACAPGEYACVDETRVAVCNHDGSALLGEFACAAGCADGACLPEPGADQCASAPQLGSPVAPNIGAGIVVHGDFEALTNQVSIGQAAGCVDSSGGGPDLIYAVDLRPGDVLQARMSTASSAYPLLYILQDCAAPDTTCLGGADYEKGANVEREARLQFLSDVAQTVYVVADSKYSSSRGAFTLEIGVSEEECGAHQTSCLGPEAMQYCDQGLYRERTCYYGRCAGGDCPAALHDVCAEALMVPNDGQVHTYRGLMQDFTDSVNLADALISCDGSTRSTPGPDAFYAVELAAGDILDVAWESSDNGAVWVTSDCANAVNTCALVANNGTPDTLTYKALDAGIYYIVADNVSAGSADGEFRIDIQVRQPECQVGTTQCLDTHTLQVCSPNYGLWVDLSCHFGCDPGAGACLPTPNDTCADATLVAADSDWQSFSAPLSQYTNAAQLADGQSCGALTASMTRGSDAIFAVDLQAAELLQAEWAGGTHGTLWVAEQCDDIGQHCLAAAAQATPSTLTFAAPHAGRFYIVGDKSSTLGGDDFTLRVRTLAPECDVDTFSSTCMDASRLQVCSALGLLESVDCPMGCEPGRGACSCGPASQPAADGDVFSDTHSGQNRLDPAMASDTGSCNFAGLETRGADHIYEVDLLQGQTLTASFQGGTRGGTGFALLYLLTTCYDVSSCVANTRAGLTGVLSYTAPQDETVYVVMDSALAASSELYDYQLSIDIR